MKIKRLSILLMWWSYFMTWPVLPSDSGVRQQVVEVRKSEVKFISKADLETIQAMSDKLRGKVSKDINKFEFALPIESFVGFNSPLQREHFLENYMEVDLYPRATYSGVIIDPVDWSKEGSSSFRTKGKLTIHGVTKECISRVILTNQNQKLSFKSDFSVMLKDYNIAIPRLVKQKISEEINISVSGDLY